jgi:hypothetical protein
MFVPQRKHAYRTPNVCYGNSFTFYMQMMVVPHRKHTYTPLRSVTGTALLYIYIYIMVVPHRKHTYEPPRPFTSIMLLDFKPQDGIFLLV